MPNRFGGAAPGDDDVSGGDVSRLLPALLPALVGIGFLAAWEALKARLRQRPIHGQGKHYSRDELHERH